MSTGKTIYDQTQSKYQSDAITEILTQITKWLKELKESESKGDINLEIYYDVKEFIKVMKTLIFDCSGILEKYHQEFESFRSVFLNSINIWKEKVRFFNKLNCFLLFLINNLRFMKIIKLRKKVEQRI